jgi:hypothetical protein
MFDISKTPTAQQASEAGYTFSPRYPDGSPTGASIIVCGPDSAAARDYGNRRFGEMQAREMAARRAGREVEPPRAEELEQQLVELAVVYTTGWEGIADGGQPMPCTADNARRLYRAHPWLRSQVVAEAQNLGNFVRPSSASCLSTPAPSSPST